MATKQSTETRSAPTKVSAKTVETRPTSVKVGFLDYSISYLTEEEWGSHPLTTDNNVGVMDGSSASIYIRDVPTMSPVHVRETLLHELLHACVFVSGLVYENLRIKEDIEEAFVGRVSPVLLDIFTTNLHVTKFILGNE